jgi:mannan endo-1,4-beta-mannosidase
VSVVQEKSAVALEHALDTPRLMVFEEFGATGTSKAETIEQYIKVFNNLRVPWSPWEISKPGKGSGDYEFWTDEPTYGVVQTGSKAALGLTAAQDWSYV